MPASFDLGEERNQMPRFVTNRWWTLILALGLVLAYVAIQPSHVRADGSSHIGQSNGTDDGGGIPPPGNGDPDVPTGLGKCSRTALRLGVSTVQARTAGDSPIVDSAVMWRLQVVMRALRGWYFRF